MNELIQKLVVQAKESVPAGLQPSEWLEVYHEKLVKAIVEETLTQVAERAYYTGDRDWSDDVDRQWIQLEFGYGPLADAQKGIFK